MFGYGLGYGRGLGGRDSRPRAPTSEGDSSKGGGESITPLLVWLALSPRGY